LVQSLVWVDANDLSIVVDPEDDHRVGGVGRRDHDLGDRRRRAPLLARKADLVAPEDDLSEL